MALGTAKLDSNRHQPLHGAQAIAILLDRRWGKAPQPHTGEDDKDIRITVRNITENRSMIDTVLRHNG